MAAQLATDLVWSAQADAKDRTKAELVKSFQSSWRTFRDLAAPARTTWAADEYVIRAAVATSRAKQLEVPFLAIHRVVDGKVSAVWLFDQHLPAHDLP